MNKTLSTFFYKSLIKHYKHRQAKWWVKLWKKYVKPNSTTPVTFQLHGNRVEVNCGYTYPLYAREFKSLNNPLLQLAYSTKKSLNRPINLIDIGAAIGDTILLINSNIDHAFDHAICIDGDSEFFSYLQKNLSSFTNVTCVHSLLSDTNSVNEKQLVRTHSGTASAQGEAVVEAKTLDTILDELKIDFTIDLLKIDVDGYDGKVLKGAVKLLKQQKPNVIFEWHPLLTSKTGNDLYEPFFVLQSCGYQTFLFYSKYGTFTHVITDVNENILEPYAQLCLRGKFDHDWHYDVIALPQDHQLDVLELAECNFANRKRSPY